MLNMDDIMKNTSDKCSPIPSERILVEEFQNDSNCTTRTVMQQTDIIPPSDEVAMYWVTSPNQRKQPTNSAKFCQSCPREFHSGTSNVPKSTECNHT
ncbi:hypothetical protein M514_22413 [Trichuris suis]|uniref:Uncharacterized protein n=1 Tax=Trichuris suis TaxID=68888 RepID=A0A085MP83_9BILA|nr:hypothetical protein M513_08729 [Trichuris suis]KFD59029.1 hypothetical protein M513_00192 [Trichuris suis]KFD65373.1 hypothetical protein M514_22413 [Trichuris suis]